MKPKTDFRIHFIGIGGIGMSGIAEVLFNQGYRVSGSDLSASETTRRLATLGIGVSIGHHADHVGQADVVVTSSAVRSDNPEVLEARRRKLSVIPRAEMLAELMHDKVGLAIAGSHGKTTTTSMAAQILTHAGLDPTIVIGGKVNAFGGNAKLGKGKFIVAEADESDGSFLLLNPTLSVITNIDDDHLDHYKDQRAIDEAFVAFAQRTPFYGRVFLCGDDPGIRRVLPLITKPHATYGLDESNQWVASEIRASGFGSRFKVSESGRYLGEAEVRIPGLHNVRNALGALALSMEAGVPWSQALEALSAFQGAKRRFDIRYHNAAAHRMIVDDYGHHPTEIEATLAAARSGWNGRVIVIFQPHRYTRTLNCHDKFCDAFGLADVVLVSDIYAAGEDPIKGVTSQALVAGIRQSSRAPGSVEHAGDLESARKRALSLFGDGDMILTLGAGSIAALPELILGDLPK